MALKVFLFLFFASSVQLNDQASEDFNIFIEISSQTKFLHPFNAYKRTAKLLPEEIYANAKDMCKMSEMIQSRKNDYVNSMKTTAMGTVRFFVFQKHTSHCAPTITLWEASCNVILSTCVVLICLHIKYHIFLIKLPL